MLIDWFTVGAQILNFIVLVWLLKRLLYRPILEAIDARERRIAGQLADAEAKHADAARQLTAYRERTDRFERQRAKLLARAVAEAKAERERMVGEARAAVEAASAAQRAQLRRELRQVSEAVGRRAQHEVIAVARKVLAELAGESLEERLGGRFAERLRAMAGEPRDLLGRAIASANEPVLVRSAFALPETARSAIAAALEERLGHAPALRFEEAPELVGGIELSAGGRKLSWSIASYLASLEQCITELAEVPVGTATGAAPADSAPAEAPPEAHVR